MCTAATYAADNFYFGRTYDNDCSYSEEIVITPRQYTFDLRHNRPMNAHFAIIGVASVENGQPLYYDGINEYGLCMAGLNFAGNAVYNDVCCEKENIAHFEMIPRILGTCMNIAQARKCLERLNITKTQVNDRLPAAQLHWIIADKTGALTVECTESGLNVYDNPVGILTNNPPFPMQMSALDNFMGLSAKQPKNTFCSKLQLNAYSNGMGALGLPGDLSSQSRFVRAAFTKSNAKVFDREDKCVSQFFHILGAVGQTLGCCEMTNGEEEMTFYTSCCNADNGVYYYTSYYNNQISAVDMHRVNLDGCAIVRYPLINTQQIKHLN